MPAGRQGHFIMSLYDYTGAIHLHSSFSYDGSTPIGSIIHDAEECGLDYLLLTDHDHLNARQQGWEGWQGKVLCIVGQEISPRFHHYLGFNITHPVDFADDPEGNHPQKYIDAVNRQGGFGIIAHPDHEGTKKFHVKHYPWNNWNVSGYTGISVWDFMTDWQKSLQGYACGFLSFLFPAYFLKGPRRITLERWDALNQIQKTVGIGELDNHATKKSLLGIPFVAFPFRRAFRFIRTHVLTETRFSNNSLEDIHLVYQSLRQARCYFALEYFRKAHGFRFEIKQNDRVFFMGDSLNLSDNTQLQVFLPVKARIRIIRNGSAWLQATEKSFSAQVLETGVYRVEVYLKSACKYRPWIFSNPIFIE
jgi:hypothetical protein